MGFPTDMFVLLFAVPRMAGWLSHWYNLWNLGLNSKMTKKIILLDHFKIIKDIEIEILFQWIRDLKLTLTLIHLLVKKCNSKTFENNLKINN